MVEIDTATISSKGQIVIPVNMRKDIDNCIACNT